jgi:GNAT superfamily N-acetyltransferase
MPAAFKIRRYKPADLGAVRALDARVGPYRPEDQAEVDAMHERAAMAPQPAYRWPAMRPGSELADSIEEQYSAFWVATLPGPGGDAIKGMTGVQPFRDMPEVGDLAVAQDWLRRGDVMELKHLRVAEESRRLGIGAALVQTVIDWCRNNGAGLLVLNTSTPQFPARALYRRMGFAEIGIAYLAGRYEVLWHELRLTPPGTP